MSVYRVALTHADHPEDSCHYGPAFDAAYPTLVREATGVEVTDLFNAAQRCAERAATEYAASDGWSASVVHLVNGAWETVA